MTGLENKIRSTINGHIHTTDIVHPTRHLITADQAIEIQDQLQEGDYISLPNLNNLAEALIYQRNSFTAQDSRIMPWDGHTKEFSWYWDDENADIFYISNANELASLGEILSGGVDFAGKTIRLLSNINLNHMTWIPLGRTANNAGVFRGTFDGNGHAIYNLSMMHTEKPADKLVNTDIAFFDHVEDAHIKSLILESVDINNGGSRGGVAALAVSSKRTVFSDIDISGKIAGNVCASFVISAVDTSFYNCVNRCSIEALSFLENGVIICGGFVGKFELSEHVRKKSNGEPVMCFNRCAQRGTITAHVNTPLNMIGMGQLYGMFIDNKLPKNVAAIIIDRCETRINRVYNYNDKYVADQSYFAIINDDECGSTKFNPEGFKRDLLDGLIGRTPTSTDIRVIRPTTSMSVNNMVIPGSVNTLHSEQHTKNFTTIKTESLTEHDGIVNLRPYYDYVTNVSI